MQKELPTEHTEKKCDGPEPQIEAFTNGQGVSLILQCFIARFFRVFRVFRSLSLKMPASLEHELTAETAKIAESYFTKRAGIDSLRSLRSLRLLPFDCDCASAGNWRRRYRRLRLCRAAGHLPI
jgi:hypothetical protein